MAHPSSTPQHSKSKKRKLSRDGLTDSAAAEHAELIRDEKVWFDDGNVIVRAGPGCTGDGPVYGFRCHSSVLAARSPVFHDMFQLPNAAGERLEGAACVDLPDDWEDVRGLLRYLYGSIDMTPLVALWHADTLKIVSGPLRLAAKYDMDSVTQELMPVLERDWPRGYDEWLLGKRGFQLRYGGTLTIPRENYPDPAAAIRLAMDIRLRSVLPAAFYELSQISIRKPLNVESYDRWADAKLLSAEDMERLTVGRERIARYLADDLFDRIDNAIRNFPQDVKHKGNHSSVVCIADLDRWWGKEHPVGGKLYFEGPLAVLQRLERNLKAEDPLDESLAEVCGGCRVELSCALQWEARAFWKKLPELFDLASLPFE
ncbi:BTB/POZ domain-containing protein [Phanerochaete sordida]|uniref:BTB/POZ domain-containing protein n=1 Tax=Phanerochaete sordida TaxID=48140 RepID=A0A9P3LBL3_9APHY|nr:BTB/POZ domain-containing protein [Phanerochaete sordida]